MFHWTQNREFSLIKYLHHWGGGQLYSFYNWITQVRYTMRIYNYIYIIIHIYNVDIETHNIASHIDPLVVATSIHASKSTVTPKNIQVWTIFFTRTCPRKVTKTSQQTQLKRRYAGNTTTSFFKKAARVMVVNSSKAHKHTRILRRE